MRGGESALRIQLPSSAQSENRKRLLLGAVIFGIYVLACASPAILFAPVGHQHILGNYVFGFRILLEGWLGVLFGIIAWYANLPFAFALALFLCGKCRAARWFSSVALAVALTSLFVRNYHFATPHGGGEREIYAYGFGFYAWIGSILLLTIGSFWLTRSAVSGRNLDVAE